MTDLIQAGKLCKEERERRGLSREDLHNATKIPVDIIRRLEEDENYLRKDPYAYFLMKVLVDYFQLDIDISHGKEEKPKENKLEEKPEKTNFFLKFFRTVFGVLAFLSVVVIFTQTKDNKEENKLTRFLQALAYSPLEETTEIKKETIKPDIKKIHLKAKDYVWLTVYIDGKEKVIKMKKGQKVNLSFKNKIRFETIGNAENLEITFNKKKIYLTEKIVHNLFVDKEGIFFNGYNLAEGEG